MPLGEHADGLLDPDPDGQCAFELGHGFLELLGVLGVLGGLLGAGGGGDLGDCALLGWSVLGWSVLGRTLLGCPGLGSTLLGCPRLGSTLLGGSVRSSPVPGGGWRAGRSGRAGWQCSRNRPLFLARQLGREQVSEHHGAGQVGQFLAADAPSGGRPPRHGLVRNGRTLILTGPGAARRGPVLR